MEKVSPEGELVMGALSALRRKIEKHDCPDCENALATLITALTRWVWVQPKPEHWRDE